MKIVLGVLVTVLLSFQAQSQIRINEVYTNCVKKKKKDCKMSNWIELYNTGEDVEGFIYFTNDRRDLTKWLVSTVEDGYEEFSVLGGEYFVISINQEWGGYNGVVEIDMVLGDSLFLVIEEKSELKILDTVMWGNTKRSLDNQSSGVLTDEKWHLDFHPTLASKNIWARDMKSKRTMNASVLLGVSGFAIESNNEQKNQPLLSYGSGLTRSRVWFKTIEFEYGFSFYKLGYNAKYKAVDSVGTVIRSRSSLQKARGLRVGTVFKVGLPITRKVTLRTGLDIALVHRLENELTVDINYSYEDGTTKQKVLNDEFTSEFGLNYFLGTVLEMEYKLNARTTLKCHYISMIDLMYNIDQENFTKFYAIQFGVDYRFWQGKRKVPNWSVMN